MGLESPLMVVIGDAVATFLWVFSSAWLQAAVILLMPYLGSTKQLEPVVLFSLLIILLIFFGPLCDALGGASFNISANVALLAAGHQSETATSVALRLPAQAIAAMMGAVAVTQVMPEPFRHTLGNPQLGPNVSLTAGMLAEGIVSGVMNFAIIWSAFSTSGGSFKSAILLMLTIVLIVAGAPFTGPYMNPSNAFGWAYVNGSHQSPEHFLVYWLAPLLASLVAAMVFRALLKPKKEKTRKKKAT